MKNPNIVVIGATGTVGTIFLDLLEKRNFPIGNIKVCASPKSIGKTIYHLLFCNFELSFQLAIS